MLDGETEEQGIGGDGRKLPDMPLDAAPPHPALADRNDLAGELTQVY